MLYFVLGLVSVVIVLVRTFLLVIGSIAASRKLHRELLAKLVRLPMAFFDTQPTGEHSNDCIALARVAAAAAGAAAVMHRRVPWVAGELRGLVLA
jgi:ABC-type bacteriocin/lantibiotic exporter with double-glycine peptidase domain